MSTPPVTETAVASSRPLPRWQQAVARFSPIAAGFTTLCCLGLPALIAFLTSIGATFLTDDATLRPLLIATLLLTLAGSGLTFRRHRNPGALIATVAAAAMIYWPLYGPTIGHSTEHAGAQAAHGTSVWVVAGLVLLIAAQAFDIWQLRRRRTQPSQPAAGIDWEGKR